MKIYNKGFRFDFGDLVFEKLTEEEISWWVCVNSNYLNAKKNEDGTTEYELLPETEKPLFTKEGRLNRWAFRLPDFQVQEKYKIPQKEYVS